MKLLFRIILTTGLALFAGAVANAAPKINVTGVTSASGSSTPASVGPGQVVTFSVAISNGGAATPADDLPVGTTASATITMTSTVTGYSFSLSGTVTSTSLILGAGGTGVMTMSATIPTQTTEAGSYSASVVLSAPSAPSGVVTMGTTTGSATGSFLSITGTPDFEITGLTYAAGTSYSGGNTIPMSISYRNRSRSPGASVNNVPWVPSTTGNSTYVRIQIVLSSNPVYGDADDFRLTFTDRTTKLNADDSVQTFSWNQLIPGNFSGSYYVLAKIDSLEANAETIENDLTLNGNNIWLDVNAPRLSIQPTNFPTNYLASTTGSASGNGYSDNPATSSDGRYTVFASDASNLVSGDTNGTRDIFIFDNQTNTTRRLNVSRQGAQANGPSNRPAITANGRYVTFESNATNLVLGDTNGFSDIFVVDTITGAISLLSVDSSGTQANNSSFRPSISSTGRYVTFESTATNLVSPATAVGISHIYVRDRDVSGSGTFDTAGNTSTVLVSQSTAGVAGTGNSLQAVISADGNYIAFASDATNLVASDTNAQRDIFLRNRTGGTTIRVSVASGGTEATGGDSRTPSISADGRYTAFASDATNLVVGDTNGVSDVFVYDRTTATTVRVSVSTAGVEASDPSAAGFKLGSINPSISSTGRYVAFASLASNLTAGDFVGQAKATDANNSLDIFVRDRDVSASGTFDTGGNVATTMVSVNKFGMQTITVLGQQSTSSSDIFPSISADGRWVAYPSDAEGASGLSHTTTNLISQDANSARDVFLFDRRTNALPGTSTAPSVTITSPGTATSILVNTAVPITASATTTVGVVSTVQFFVNGTSLGTSSTFPYTQTWTPTAVGTYILSALVTDSFGNLGVSANVSVTVNAAPSVGVTSPVAGSTITTGVAQTVTATAAATTPGATISSVQFFANGVSLGTSFAAPFSAPWTPASAGSFNLIATATDSSGIRTTSPAVAITVTAPGGGGGGGGLTAPIVSITTPADGSTINVNTPQIVNATASLANGTVTSVAFSANGVLIGSATAFPYTVQWSPTTAGTFTLSAVATGNNGAQATTTNTITVTSPGAPTVTLTSPLGGSVLPVNTPTAIYATAASAVGTVKNVQFYANGVLLSTSTVFPYNAPFTPTSPGIYVLFAVATDNVGNQTTSSAISVTVSGGTAPTVAITAPAAGSTVGVNLPQTITAVAASTGGFIANVQFLVNGVVLTTASAFPYITAWTPTAVGTYTLSARATDNSGNVTASAPVSITVAASAPPTVSITGPATGSSYTVGSSLNITANAADSDGTIAKVAFFVNGILLSAKTTSPYVAAGWAPASAGVYTLTAQATDNTGNVTTSSPVIVTIGANAAPTVALTSPAAGLNFSLGNNVLIAAVAADSDGSVTNLQFFANGISVGSVSAPPYNFSWKPPGAGTFALTAVATDNSGNSTTSAAVTISVTAAAAPTVSITNPVTGATFGVGTSIPINAATTGGNGAISQVQFFVNGASIGTSATAAPYNTLWTPTSAGTYTLLAVATDNAGVSGTSSAISVVISPNGAPSVTLVSPGTNLVVGLGTSVNLSATASDTDGTIASVRFLANGTLLASKAALPYSTIFTPTASGIYTVVAQATDNSGNVTDSVAQTITVLGGNVPIVTLKSPAADTTISADSSLLLAASAAINSGIIARVDFYAGSTLLASKTVSPYTYVWVPGVTGSYAIRAVAFDGNGTGVSSSVSTVTATAARSSSATRYVAITNPVNGSSLVAFRNITLSAVDNLGNFPSPSVDYYINGTFFQTVATAPYQVTFNFTNPGPVQLYAVARLPDSVYTSVPVSLTILGNAPPSVSVTAPTTGSTINVGSAVTIKASATDPDDLIDTVKFLVNGQVLSTSSAFPYTAPWTPTSEGVYTITAIAKDSQGSVGGNQTTSAPIYVRVTAPASAGGTGGAPDAVYAGTYAGGTEFGKFAVISAAGKSAAFIAFSTTSGAKTYFYPNLPLDVAGGFSTGTAINGHINDTGASGAFDNNRLSFIGPVVFASATKVASGYYTGNIANRPASTLAGIVGADGSIMVYVSDGSFADAGSGAVDSTGAFSLTLVGGSKLVGKVDPATGFMAGNLTGGPGGTFMAALASGGSFSDGTLRNLSTRGQVGTGTNILIAGFVVGGTTSKQVLVRAIGPTLSTFGITGALADSQVELFKGTTRIALNDNWAGNPAIIAASAAVGAFPLAASSLDAVVLAQLDPGAYTAQVSGTGGKTGVALVELYDVDTPSAFSPQKVINVSTRGVVGTGENVLIAGFVVSGSTSKKLLIRGIGPSLTPLGVTGALADPVLQIIRSDRTVVRENDNWETGNDSALVAAATAKVGAFPLASGSKDSVILINLPPGTYNATVSGVGGSTGVGLVEVYEVP